MLAVGLCSITALGGRRWSAPCWQPEAWVVPSGLELLSPAWLPLYQDHSEELFFLHLCSLHVFLPSISIVSSMLLGGTVDVWWRMRPLLSWGTIQPSAVPTPLCGRPSLQTTISQSSRKTEWTLLPFNPVPPNSMEWEFCHPSPQMWPNMAAQSQLALFFPDNFLPSSQIQKRGGEE